MMRGTPRTFVGSMVFRLEDPVDDDTAAAVRRTLGQVEGISRCEVDQRAATVVVTAAAAVDAADLVAALDHLGCRVRS